MPPKRILPTFTEINDQELNLSNVIRIALGAASVCWDDEGVFETERANQIADELMEIVPLLGNPLLLTGIAPEGWLTRQLAPLVEEEKKRAEMASEKTSSIYFYQGKEYLHGSTIAVKYYCSECDWELIKVAGMPISPEDEDIFARHIAEQHMPSQSQSLPSRPKFRKALEELINANSIERWSNTPDFILAGFLSNCLKSFDQAVVARDGWYLNGERLTPAQTPAEQAEWLARTGLLGDPEERAWIKNKLTEIFDDPHLRSKT